MKRNKFSLSNYKLQSMRMGELIPVNWEEVLPGDSFQQSTSALIRVSPLVAPVMHPVAVRIHHWFVPNRLIWDGFEDFITGGEDGLDETIPPYKLVAQVGEGGLADYLGIPTADTYDPELHVSMLPFRAYQLIYNENYRDQDLVPAVVVAKESGQDLTTDPNINKVAWEKDYFTTARLTEAKGPEITIPMLGSAPILPSQAEAVPTFGSVGHADAIALYGADTATQIQMETSQSGIAQKKWADPALIADLSAATGISINDLRFALAQQRYQEARNQFGSRYVEYLKYLGIRNPSDARLHNPEYIGGGRQTIQFSEVLKHSEVSAELDPTGSPLGTMGGHGITAMRTNRYRRYFEEHGILMTLMSVVPKAIYSSQLQRKWLRQTKEEYYQKELVYLGDQEITNKEVQANHSVPDGIFGYQGRYDEYRHGLSGIAGEYRSILSHWHMARMFETDVALNQTFIESDPTDRIYASTETDPLLCMINNNIQVRRMLPRDPQPKTF